MVVVNTAPQRYASAVFPPSAVPSVTYHVDGAVARLRAHEARHLFDVPWPRGDGKGRGRKGTITALARAPRATTRAPGRGHVDAETKMVLHRPAWARPACLPRNLCHGVRTPRPVWPRTSCCFPYLELVAHLRVCLLALQPYGTQTASPELAWEGLRDGPASPLTVGWVRWVLTGLSLSVSVERARAPPGGHMGRTGSSSSSSRNAAVTWGCWFDLGRRLTSDPRRGCVVR